ATHRPLKCSRLFRNAEIIRNTLPIIGTMTTDPRIQIRPARLEELPAVVDLCMLVEAQHEAYWPLRWGRREGLREGYLGWLSRRCRKSRLPAHLPGNGPPALGCVSLGGCGRTVSLRGQMQGRRKVALLIKIRSVQGRSRWPPRDAIRDRHLYGTQPAHEPFF